jgi:excisionase family DNA binding protein
MVETDPPQPGAALRTASPEWLSLGPASRVVGVDPDTLRRWADDGRVRAYATPGGHRRFAVADLQRVVTSRRPRRRPLSALGATPQRLNRAYARAYRAPDAPGAFRMKLTDADVTAFRADGRRLVDALVGYLDAASDAARRRREAEAMDLVRATGGRMRSATTDTTEAIAAFTSARRPFLTELAAIGRRRSLDVAHLTALYEEAVALLDRLLLIFVDAFQHAKGASAR